MDPATIAIAIVVALVLVGAVSHFDIRAAIRRMDTSIANMDRTLERMDRSAMATERAADGAREAAVAAREAATAANLSANACIAMTKEVTEMVHQFLRDRPGNQPAE
jgi:hypothetical protein